MKRVLSLVLVVCMLLALSVNAFAVKALNDITIITDITETMSIASATDFGLQSGSFSFDASTNTLTLNNAVLSHTNGSSLFFVNGEDPSITVTGKGTMNGYLSTRMCVISNADLVINGEVSCDWIYNSKIKINSNEISASSPALMLYKELKNSTVDIKTKGYGIRLADNNIVIEDSKIIIDAEVCGILDNMMGPPVMSQFAVSFEVDDLTVFDIKAPTPLNNFDINKVSASDTLKTAMQAVISNTNHVSNPENGVHFVMGSINGSVGGNSEEEILEADPEVDIMLNGKTATVKYANNTIVLDKNLFNSIYNPDEDTCVIDFSGSNAIIDSVILPHEVVKILNHDQKNVTFKNKTAYVEYAVKEYWALDNKTLNSIKITLAEGNATYIQKKAMNGEVIAQVDYKNTSNGKTLGTDAKIYVPCTVENPTVYYIIDKNTIGTIGQFEVIDGYCVFDRYLDGTYIITK